MTAVKRLYNLREGHYPHRLRTPDLVNVYYMSGVVLEFEVQKTLNHNFLCGYTHMYTCMCTHTDIHIHIYTNTHARVHTLTHTSHHFI